MTRTRDEEVETAELAHRVISMTLHRAKHHLHSVAVAHDVLGRHVRDNDAPKELRFVHDHLGDAVDGIQASFELLSYLADAPYPVDCSFLDEGIGPATRIANTLIHGREIRNRIDPSVRDSSFVAITPGRAKVGLAGLLLYLTSFDEMEKHDPIAIWRWKASDGDDYVRFTATSEETSGRISKNDPLIKHLAAAGIACKLSQAPSGTEIWLEAPKAA